MSPCAAVGVRIPAPQGAPGATQSRQSDAPVFVVGQRVRVLGKEKEGSPGTEGVGMVRFVGTATFRPGQWVGVALDGPNGRHDGEVEGQRYFTCEAGHGLMVRPDNLALEGAGPATDGDALAETAPRATRRPTKQAGLFDR